MDDLTDDQIEHELRCLSRYFDAKGITVERRIMLCAVTAGATIGYNRALEQVSEHSAGFAIDRACKVLRDSAGGVSLLN